MRTAALVGYVNNTNRDGLRLFERQSFVGVIPKRGGHVSEIVSEYLEALSFNAAHHDYSKNLKARRKRLV